MHLVILMEPVGKARARTVRTKHGKITTYTPDKTAHAENIIKDQIINMDHSEYFAPGVPLWIEATFYLTKPVSVSKKRLKPVVKPDWDNLGKLVTDAMEGLSYYNDSMITSAVIKKRYGSPARIEILLERDTSE